MKIFENAKQLTLYLVASCFLLTTGTTQIFAHEACERTRKENEKESFDLELNKTYRLLFQTTFEPKDVSLIKISGIVFSDLGEPVEGASVSIKEKNLSTLTDKNGHFEIDAKPGDVLIVTYIGYATMEYTVIDENPITITIQTISSDLSEVVVVAYGKQNKRTITGSQSLVAGEELVKLALPSVTEMLQGKIAGLQSVSSGQPGGSSEIRIRGISSITAGSEPLYIVNGIPVNAGDLSRLTTSSSALAGLNPNDIDNVTVLKDASSASIYGSRAANGVIVITTKNGIKGSNNVQINAEGGFTDMNIPSNARPLNKEEYLMLTQEGMRNAGYNDNQIHNQLMVYGANNPETNWLEEVTRRGHHQQVNASVSGGSEKTTFYISSGYFNQQATTINSNFRRYSSSISILHERNERLKFRMGFNGSLSNQNTPSNSAYYANPIFGAFLLRPTQNPYNPDGSINLSLSDFPNGGVYNQIAEAKLNTRDYKNGKILGFGRIEYSPIPNLTLSSQYGIDYNGLEESLYRDPRFGDGYAYNGQGLAYYTRYFNWTWTNLADYHLELIKDKNFYTDIKLGYEAQKSLGYNISAEGTNFPGSKDLTELVNAASPIEASANGADYAFSGFLSSILLSYDNKYVLSGSFRRDGSSRFGIHKRFGNFYSIGAAWTISKEDFWESLEGIVPAMKIRFSYGLNGNANIDNYIWHAVYQAGNNYNLAPGTLPANVGNDNLTWEINKPFNIGFDASLLKNRLSLTVDYYKRTTSQLLLDAPLSQVTGFPSMIDNVGAMVNKGWEFFIQATPIVKSNFSWGVNANVALNKNKITALYDDQEIISGQHIRRVGHDFQTYYMPEWAGVDPSNGDPLWYLNTINNDGTLNKNTTNDYNSAQRIITGKSASPDAIGGFGSTFKYKGVSLDAQFSFTFGNYLRDQWIHYYFSDGYNPSYNKQARQLDRWQRPGDVTDVPRYVFGGNNASYLHSTRFLYKGDFIRLRSVTLSYDLPSKMISKMKATSAQFYLRSTNPFRITFDKNLPMDPEIGINGEQDLNPFINQVFSAGLNLNF